MAPNPLSIAFHGAARTVTGSRHLLTFGGTRWLVDCGLYQGHRDEAERINRQFKFAASEIDAVVVTHAHLDHIGNLPTLVSRGFGGPITLTPATADLSRVMLADSAYLMQRDVEHVNKRRGGRPVRAPLYTVQDVTDTLERFETHAYGRPFELFPGVTVEYLDAGHILGSAMALHTIRSDGRILRVLMGGDLGRPRRPILRDPAVPAGGCDVLVLESTYGDRLHADETGNEQALVDILQRTLARGGRVVVPAFAVGRTQELVAVLHGLFERGLVSDVPMFVDSPMAREATAVFRRHPECFDEATAAQFAEGRGEPFGFGRLRYVGSVEESKALNDLNGPCILISASGMCEGGRVLHHLERSLGDARNTVLFVGFQGEGTLGRRLRDGAETVHVFGEPVRVRAEVAALDGFSAHADQRELLDWVLALDPLPRTIFLVHGEPGPMDTLAQLLRERTGATVHAPEPLAEYDLWT
jgi:metallo-beta-lactamase family protein